MTSVIRRFPRDETANIWLGSWRKKEWNLCISSWHFSNVICVVMFHVFFFLIRCLESGNERRHIVRKSKWMAKNWASSTSTTQLLVISSLLNKEAQKKFDNWTLEIVPLFNSDRQFQTISSGKIAITHYSKVGQLLQENIFHQKNLTSQSCWISDT